jgi:hypothetical protein
MTEGIKKVRAYSLYLWIVTGAVIAFNTAAAMADNAQLTYMALALTGAAALAGIGFGIWAGCTVVKEHRQS